MEKKTTDHVGFLLRFGFLLVPPKLFNNLCHLMDTLLDPIGCLIHLNDFP